MWWIIPAGIIILFLVGITATYWFVYEAGYQRELPGRTVKRPGPTNSSASRRALETVRKKVIPAISWSGVKGVRPGAEAISKISRIFNDITKRQLALLDGNFPAATALVTDKEPFSYETLWNSCLNKPKERARVIRARKQPLALSAGRRA